jgi:hypothetical protein
MPNVSSLFARMSASIAAVWTCITSAKRNSVPSQLPATSPSIPERRGIRYEVRHREVIEAIYRHGWGRDVLMRHPYDPVLIFPTVWQAETVWLDLEPLIKQSCRWDHRAIFMSVYACANCNRYDMDHIGEKQQCPFASTTFTRDALP